MTPDAPFFAKPEKRRGPCRKDRVRTDEDMRNELWSACEAFLRLSQEVDPTRPQFTVARGRILRACREIQCRTERRRKPR